MLLSDEFRSYVAEIIIEGHTDSNGTYLHNLQLSQERALSVANYVLGDSFMSDTLGLNASAKKTLLGLVTASGRSARRCWTRTETRIRTRPAASKSSSA